MAQIYGYDVSTGELRMFPSREEWRAQLTIAGIQAYLREHLREQITREFPVANRAFVEASERTEVDRGFWSEARILFPSLEALGLLYSAKTDPDRPSRILTTENSTRFLLDYVGRVNGRYLQVGELIYSMYRHGLTHTAMPKMLCRSDGHVFGWTMTFEKRHHLLTTGIPGSTGIVFCGEQFYEDLVAALDLYTSDFSDPTRAPNLFAAFEKGFALMGTPETPRRAELITALASLS